jgi:MFS transporter, DHA1 family, inner membrane transport protein
MNKQEKIVLFLLAALNFTHILDFMILMPLGNYLMPHFHLSPQQFSFLVSVYAFSAGASSFGSAFFVNDFDRKKVLIFAYIGFLLGTFACGIAPSYVFLLIARTIAGIFGGMIGAQVISIVADIIPFERRGKAMGVIMTAFAVASTLGVPFSLFLANAFDFHAPFLFVAFIGIILIPFLYKYLPQMDGHMENNSGSKKREVITQVFNEKKQILALLFTFLMFFGHFIIIPFINPFLEFNKGIPKSVTPYVYLFGGLSSFIAANVIGHFSDRVGKWKTYIASIVVSIPFVLIITNLPNVHIIIVLTIFSCWFIAATGRGVASQALVSNVVNPQYRGSFQSFSSFMQQLGTGSASLVAGMLVSKAPNGQLIHFDYLGYISVLVLGITLVVGSGIFGKVDG